MDVAVAEEPQRKVFRARKTMRNSDRRQLESLHATLSSRCSAPSPPRLLPLENGKHVEGEAPTEVDKENEGVEEGGVDGGPQELPYVDTLDTLTLFNPASALLSSCSPSLSPSHTAESDQEVRPGFLVLSEDEDGLVESDEEKGQDQGECEEGTEMEPIESDIEKEEDEQEDGKSQEEKEKEHKGSNNEDDYRESTEGETMEAMTIFHSSVSVDPPPPCATLPQADEGEEHWVEECALQRKRTLFEDATAGGGARDEEELKRLKKRPRVNADGQVERLECRSTVEGVREGGAVEKPTVDGVRDEGEVEWLMKKRWIRADGERDGEEVEREEKMPRTVEGEELEAHLELQIHGSPESRRRLEKVVQQLVGEQLRVLQLTMFDRSLQELRDRVDKMDYSKHHSVVNSLQKKIARISSKFVAANQAMENARKPPEVPVLPAKAKTLTPASTNVTTTTPEGKDNPSQGIIPRGPASLSASRKMKNVQKDLKQSDQSSQTSTPAPTGLHPQPHPTSSTSSSSTSAPVLSFTTTTTTPSSPTTPLNVSQPTTQTLMLRTSPAITATPILPAQAQAQAQAPAPLSLQSPLSLQTAISLQPFLIQLPGGGAAFLTNRANNQLIPMSSVAGLSAFGTPMTNPTKAPTCTYFLQRTPAPTSAVPPEVPKAPASPAKPTTPSAPSTPTTPSALAVLSPQLAAPGVVSRPSSDGNAQTSSQTGVPEVNPSSSTPRSPTGAQPSVQQATPVLATALPPRTGYIAALLSGEKGTYSTLPPVRPAASSKTGTQVNQPSVKPAAPVTAPAGPSKTGTVKQAAPVSAPTGPSKTGTQASKQAAKSTASKTSTQVPVKQSGAFIDLTEEEEDDDDVLVMGVQKAPSAASTPLAGQKTTFAPAQTGTSTAAGKQTVKSSPGMNSAGGPVHTVHHRPLQGSPSKNLSSTTTTTTTTTTTATTTPAASPSKPFTLPPNVPPLPVMCCGLMRLPPEAEASLPPQQPQLKLARVQSQNGIVLSWSVAKVDQNCAAVDRYHLYAYHQDASAPEAPKDSAPSSPWKKIGEVKALPLPMACTLTQFMSGSTYYFAVRARDAYGRFGPFCEPQCTDVIRSLPAS